MSTLEEKLNLLKKKKLTAKTVVEQQRNELRLLKSPLTLNQRLEELYKRFDNNLNLDNDLYKKILRNQTLPSTDQIHRTIEDLSELIEQILNILSLQNHVHPKIEQVEILLKKQKESFKLIKLKLSDIYAHRVADEVSCITS